MSKQNSFWNTLVLHGVTLRSSTWTSAAGVLTTKRIILFDGSYYELLQEFGKVVKVIEREID